MAYGTAHVLEKDVERAGPGIRKQDVQNGIGQGNSELHRTEQAEFRTRTFRYMGGMLKCAGDFLEPPLPAPGVSFPRPVPSSPVLSPVQPGPVLRKGRHKEGTERGSGARVVAISLSHNMQNL